MHIPASSRRALALLPVLAALVASGSPASAATLNCSASAARVTVLGTTTVEPTTANVGAQTCKSVTSKLNDALAGLNPVNALLKPVTAQAVAAWTTYSDGAGDPLKQTALAAGGVADLTVNALPSIPGLNIDQITAPVSAAGVPLNAIPVDVSSLPAFQSLLPLVQNQVKTALGGSTVFTVDATQVVANLVPAARALTTTPLVGVKAAMAYAVAGCKNGEPTVAGVPDLAGLTIAGQEIPTNAVTTRAVQLLPSVSVDFSKAAVTAVSQISSLPGGLGTAGTLLGGASVINDLILSTVNSTLAKLPVVSVPALSANVTVTPGTATTGTDTVTQRALTIAASVANIKLADIVIGEATASGKDLACAAAVPATPTQATLQCTTRDLVLVDVLERAGRVALTGVADPKYIGKRVSIVFEGTGQTVARPIVKPDGSFDATAPLPRQSLLGSNRARYVARIGAERSMNLKLRRRLIVTRMVSRGGRVTIAGRVVGPLPRPAAPITLRQRVSCTKDKVVRTFRPRPNGTFSITVPQPSKGGTAVYRLTTKVLFSAHGKALSDTFTLPRAVELHR